MKLRVEKKEEENCDITIQKRGQNGTERNYEWKPSSKQIDVVRLLIDMEQRLSISEICSKAGVGRTTMYRWLQNEDFKAYFNQLLGLETDIAIIEAWRCLLKAAKMGSVQAATKILEIKGMFTPRLQHEISGDPNNPIRTEVYIPQFNMPPPPQKRDRRTEESQKFLEDLQTEKQLTFAESLEVLDDEDI